MATTNGSTAIRDKILASLARYRALRIGKFPCAFWRLSARPGLTAKVRPALVISSADAFNSPIGHSVMAMITSAKQSDWPLDTPITDLNSSGLPAPSLIRLKLFTLDHRLIISSLGQLSKDDQLAFQKNFNTLIGS